MVQVKAATEENCVRLRETLQDHTVKSIDASSSSLLQLVLVSWLKDIKETIEVRKLIAAEAATRKAMKEVTSCLTQDVSALQSKIKRRAYANIDDKLELAQELVFLLWRLQTVSAMEAKDLHSLYGQKCQGIETKIEHHRLLTEVITIKRDFLLLQQAMFAVWQYQAMCDVNERNLFLVGEAQEQWEQCVGQLQMWREKSRSYLIGMYEVGASSFLFYLFSHWIHVHHCRKMNAKLTRRSLGLHEVYTSSLFHRCFLHWIMYCKEAAKVRKLTFMVQQQAQSQEKIEQSVAQARMMQEKARSNLLAVHEVGAHSLVFYLFSYWIHIHHRWMKDAKLTCRAQEIYASSLVHLCFLHWMIECKEAAKIRRLTLMVQQEAKLQEKTAALEIAIQKQSVMAITQASISILQLTFGAWIASFNEGRVQALADEQAHKAAWLTDQVSDCAAAIQALIFALWRDAMRTNRQFDDLNKVNTGLISKQKQLLSHVHEQSLAALSLRKSYMLQNVFFDWAVNSKETLTSKRLSFLLESKRRVQMRMDDVVSKAKCEVLLRMDESDYALTRLMICHWHSLVVAEVDAEKLKQALQRHRDCQAQSDAYQTHAAQKLKECKAERDSANRGLSDTKQQLGALTAFALAQNGRDMLRMLIHQWHQQSASLRIAHHKCGALTAMALARDHRDELRKLVHRWHKHSASVRISHLKCGALTAFALSRNGRDRLRVLMHQWHNHSARVMSTHQKCGALTAFALARNSRDELLALMRQWRKHSASMQSVRQKCGALTVFAIGRSSRDGIRAVIYMWHKHMSTLQASHHKCGALVSFALARSERDVLIAFLKAWHTLIQLTSEVRAAERRCGRVQSAASMQLEAVMAAVAASQMALSQSAEQSPRHRNLMVMTTPKKGDREPSEISGNLDSLDWTSSDHTYLSSSQEEKSLSACAIPPLRLTEDTTQTP